ncbi:MAG TPA: hypothetical protein VGF55_19460 [Gemmataceae bacterium]|jgi:hypothetical protein
MSDVANPYADLARLAGTIHEFEQGRYLKLGTKMPALPERETAMTTALLDAAQRAEVASHMSGWPAPDVHRIVTDLMEACRCLMAWATLRGDWHQLSGAVLAPLRHVQAMANSYQGRQADARDGAKPPAKTKRGTARGDARTKIIPALTEHHQYANGGTLNAAPIGVNELAR